MQETELLDLFDQYSGMVYRIAFSYLRQSQDAEDIVQAVFLKLIEGSARPIIGKERAFLTRITINQCKDALRSVWKQRVESLDDEIIFEQEEDKELFQAVMALPKKLRIVVHLHYYEGYTFAEIAIFLSISSSAVSMRIHRARKILKDKLKEDTSLAIRKSRLDKKYKLILIAVAVLSLGLLSGFTYGRQIIQLLGGGYVEMGREGGYDYFSMSMGFTSDPVEVKNGQVFFVLDGSNKEITSYCTAETYFQYEYIDEDGYRHVVLVGGEVNNLGWGEFLWDKDGKLIGSNATYFESDSTPRWLELGEAALAD